VTQSNARILFRVILLATAWLAIQISFASDPPWQQLGDRAAADIRAAANSDDIDERNQLVEQALVVLDRIVADPASPDHAVRRSRLDRIVALRTSERMVETVTAYDRLLDDGLEPPFYVTEAAADAWLQLKQPIRAEKLYRQVLSDLPGFSNASMGLFYALLEMEDFDGAFAVIDQAVDNTVGQPGSWPWTETRATAAMARAYANRLEQAQHRLEALRNEQPDNARVLRDLATVYRWRGWPHLALETADQAAEQAPDHVGITLLRANILSDLGRYAEAGELFEMLYAINPENLHVQRDHEAWKQRRRWSIHLHGEYGDSSGSAIAQFGSRDRAWGMRLNAPWLGEHVQPYLLYHYSDARFPEGEADYDRLGAGASWRHHRQHAYLEIHRNRTGTADTGLVAGYDWHAGDRWSFATRYEGFSTDIPLRARRHDIDGWKIEAGARWQAHESFGVRTNLSRLDISDGNVRWSGLIALPHRLRSSAHHITDATLDLYGSRASQSGGPYFNPTRDGSLTYVIEHDWLTWRRYEQSFSQRFVIGGGGYWQEGFGTHAIGLLGYEHVWRFSPRWRLHYGAGLASRVYDGDRERRLHGHLSLQGVF
jgi:biofilm PGA synthesis protein PgaA